MLTLVDLKHMKKWEEKVFPIMEECKDLMRTLRKENNEQKECIRNFDASLCTKANKSGLVALEQSIHEGFVQNKDYLNLKQDLKEADLARERGAAKTKQDFIEFQAVIENEITLICQSVLKRKLLQYEGVAKQFQAFFNTEEIQMIMDKKVDVEVFKRANNLQAPMTELEATNSFIKQLNARLKHLSILVTELAKQAVPSKASSSFKSGETLNSKIQRRDFLSRQAQIVSTWITDTSLAESQLTSGVAKRKLKGSMETKEAPLEVIEFEKHHIYSQIPGASSLEPSM